MLTELPLCIQVAIDPRSATCAPGICAMTYRISRLLGTLSFSFLLNPRKRFYSRMPVTAKWVAERLATLLRERDFCLREFFAEFV
jgi:hypothetical protein